MEIVDGGHELMSFAPEDARRRMEEQFRATAERPLFTGNAVRPSFVLNQSICDSHADVLGHSYRHPRSCHMSTARRIWRKEIFFRILGASICCLWELHGMSEKYISSWSRFHLI